MVVWYVNIETKRFWVTLTRYESKDFTAFKASIIRQYPGAAKGARYTIHDLKRVILNTAELDISTETKLVQYYWQFCPIAVWLVANSKISMQEHDQYFWQGLPQAAHLVIAQHLQHTETNYTHNEATNFEKVIEAGCFVLWTTCLTWISMNLSHRASNWSEMLAYRKPIRHAKPKTQRMRRKERKPKEKFKWGTSHSCLLQLPRIALMK
jgi:hypothetical protein